MSFPQDVTQRADDRGALLEYSVVYTDRAINLMAKPFVEHMKDISSTLREAYEADHLALVPGSGTYGMETVARALAVNDASYLVIRNGFFSFRWTQIFESFSYPHKVLKASYDPESKQASAPSLSSVLEEIEASKPSVVFMPHVETSTGILLPTAYIKSICDKVHGYGGKVVVDAIAAGTLWLSLSKVGVDVLITAPQKGWSSPACCGIVLMKNSTYEYIQSTESKFSTFSMNLKQWLSVMKQYESGNFKYYTTLPTDSLTVFAKTALEVKQIGFQNMETKAKELGSQIRLMLSDLGYKSVAAKEFASPTVVVVYKKDEDVNLVAKLKEKSIQVAGGVPFKIDEPEGTGAKAFRVGLFGIEKLSNVERTVDILRTALQEIN
eukprot:maker-scaffold_9-snap-gene-4.5-mRNA-1 protein AED:0.01 eAED:0.01 QI:102/1/1/1/0.5/0.33/3/103/380